MVDHVHFGNIVAHDCRDKLCLLEHVCHMQLASLLALLMAWLFIFDTVQKERASLEDSKKEGIVGQTADVEIGNLRSRNSGARAGDSVGHAIGRPNPEAAANQPGNRMPETYAEVVGTLCTPALPFDPS